MTARRITRKFLKITAYFLGVLLVLMTAFHFWFIYHAEGLVEDLVSFQSKNTLALKVDKFKFNWFTYRMELRNPVFYSTSLTASTSYQFRIKKMDIRVRAILPLLFEKKILIDSLHLDNPDIIVTKLRVNTKDTTGRADTSVSLTQEMGRIYNSIQDALSVLDVNSFQIDKGKFSLINRINLSESPVVITNIHLHLDNLKVDSTEEGNEKKILFSDNVALHTTNQNIVFPDGRHRLSFSQFRINILKRFVEFDSCTIMATRGDSASNSFRVFFDKLQMTNIDFATLYHNEIIKADSVYCINPRFRLDVDLPKRKGSGISPPKLDELVQQLTGDMQLAFVVVENGAFDINTIRDGRPSSFTSDHNNFELQGLEINKSNDRALTVDKFVMAIRNYENFLRDSAYAIQFDSILINNNRISLSNFGYKELQNNRTVNSFSMPSFELQGLSWDELIYDQQLKADKVTLNSPVINYNIAKNKRAHSGDIFQALAGIGSFMQLEQLNINKGQINLLFKNDAALMLENADVSVQANQLVNSRELSNIQRSVNDLYFERGVFTMGHLIAILSGVKFNGANDQLQAARVEVKNESNLDIDAARVIINTLLIDDNINQTVINGVSWKKADIKLASFPRQAKTNSVAFHLKDIVGANTNLLLSDSGKRFSLYLKELSADEISTMAGSKPIVNGLKTSGTDLQVTNGALHLNIDNVQVADHHLSILNNVAIKKMDERDSLDIRIPQLEFEPDINAFIDGTINTANVRIVRPNIQLNITRTGNEKSLENNVNLPKTSVSRLVIEQPTLRLSSNNTKGLVTLNWDGRVDKIVLTDVEIAHNSPTRISSKNVELSLHNFLYTGAGGKKFDAKDGKLNVQLNDVELQQTETNAWDWKGVVTRLDARNFIIDSLGKKCATLTLSTARLNDFSVVSTSLLNMRELIASNTRFRLGEFTGSYNDGKNHYSWYNTNYDKYTRMLSADSFAYQPVKDQQSFINESPWQSDYITAKTGAISFGPFDIEKYIRDTVMDMGVLNVDDGRLTVFRDKRLPRKPGIVRPLPSEQLKEIPLHLQIDTMNVNNSHVDYEEFNEKTNEAGKITVADLNGRITRVRNHNLHHSDSLHLVASAFIADSIFTKLNVKQSYTDSLGGFLMTVQMGRANLALINPVLRALASAELKSGRLDTLSMRVVGREELAFGEIKMSYHNLKVLVLKKGGRKRPLLSGIQNFFANTLIKNESNEKGSRIFIRRQKDRSAINYLVKITLNGITNTITGKKSKKAYRKNKKEIAKKPLPPAGM